MLHRLQVKMHPHRLRSGVHGSLNLEVQLFPRFSLSHSLLEVRYRDSAVSAYAHRRSLPGFSDFASSQSLFSEGGKASGVTINLDEDEDEQPGNADGMVRLFHALASVSRVRSVL